jgi:hypothetical protein
MIHGRPNNRYAQRDIDRSFKIDQLHRYVPLIVIHCDHKIVSSA